MSPYHERIPAGAPSKKIVSNKNLGSTFPDSEKHAIHSPRVLDHKAQVVIPGKPDSLLDVLWRSGIDANYWHVPLLTRNAEGGVEVATLDGPIGEGVRLVVGVLCSTRLIRTPDAVVPTSEDIGAVPCSKVVARGGRRDRTDEWLRDFRCEGLELGIGRPTFRSRCTAAVSGRFRRYRRQAESDGQERHEEKHDCLVRLGCGKFQRARGDL
jgi:hypothetical protein